MCICNFYELCIYFLITFEHIMQIYFYGKWIVYTGFKIVT